MSNGNLSKKKGLLSELNQENLDYISGKVIIDVDAKLENKVDKEEYDGFKDGVSFRFNRQDNDISVLQKVQGQLSNNKLDMSAFDKYKSDAASNFANKTDLEKKADKADLGKKADLVNGKIPSSQLPGYVDDIIEGDLLDDETFEPHLSNSNESNPNAIYVRQSGKLYVDTTTGKTYRWSGTKYVEVSSNLALGETSSTAYSGDKGKQNAENIKFLARYADDLREDKVDKVEGKQLSTEDYTTAEKEKLENTVGEKSEGENSAIFGSSTNEFGSFELPTDLYYKPIEPSFCNIKVDGMQTVNTSVGGDNKIGEDPSNGNGYADILTCYLVINGKIYQSSIGSEHNPESVLDSYLYYNTTVIPKDIKEGTPILVCWTADSSLIPIIQYKFENLTFTTNKADTELKQLYTYTDLWGNKCYTVYEDYSPDNAKDETAEDAVSAVSDDDPMLKGIKYEALFNKGAYFAVADGDNAFSSGEDNVASGDDTFSVGYRNIVLADGSTALGRKLLVRGVGANGFGLNGKATGRYAIAFNEAGQALGYATLVFGDHCGAYDSYGVAGGFKSKNYAKMTFLYGNECIADKDVRNSFGGGDKIHIYKGFDNFIWGKELEGAGNYNGIVGAFHNIIGHNNFVGGNTNYVGSSDNMVGGTKNTIKNYPDKAQNGRAIISGANNILEAGWGVALLGYHLHNIVGNNVLMTGEHNTNSGLYSVNCGNYNNSNGIYNVMLGMYLTALKGPNVMLGRHLESEGSHCTLIGEFLKATGYFKTIIGKYNAPSNNPFVVAYGFDDANTKNIFEVTEGGKAISKETETEAVILKAQNGNKFILTVNNNGELVTKGA